MAIETRPFGKTGHQATVLALGCGSIGFGNVPHEAGVAVVRRALDHGINYIDTAHLYESEAIVGDALQGRRDEAFLVTKTIKRNRDAAWRDIQQSLRLLRTDHIDLLHMHCVNTFGDLDAVCGKGGSLEAAIEARRLGLVRFIGITGHARPSVLATALDRFPFDAVMSAMGAMDTLINDPVRYVVPTVKRAGCGIAAMKVLGCGRMTDRPELALRYSLSLGAHTAVIGVKNFEELDQLVAATQHLAPLTPTEHNELFALASRELHGRDNQAFWLGDAEVLAYRTGWVGAKAS